MAASNPRFGAYFECPSCPTDSGNDRKDRGVQLVESFVHLHPDLDARRVGSTISLSLSPGGVVSEIEVLNASEIALEKGWHCPEFGKRRENIVIRLSSSGLLPQSLGYRIVK